MTVHFKDIPTHEKVLPPQSLRADNTSLADGLYRRFFKRALDLIAVFVTAWFTVPTILALAVAILATGQSPFYAQKRIGKGGKAFRMWKLQTMLPNADERLEQYLSENPEAREEWDAKQKLANDPRVTPIGAWLRKSSLDELPQLFNVFNGTMSLVGPRPMMLDQKDQYPGTSYFKLLPGMTGPWQVSDRNACDFADRAKFDDVYDKNLSFFEDAKLLVQTVSVVVRGTGC